MPQNAANLETAPFGVPVANASGSALTSVTLNDGQVLIGRSGNAPVAATLTAGSDVTITNGPGSIEIAASGGGAGDVVWNSINTVVITSSTTYTPPAGLQFLVIEACAGGGRTPAQSAPTSGEVVYQPGGGGSGYGITMRTAAQVGASATVTIGASISSTFGGNTTWVDDAGTLTIHGGRQGNRVSVTARLSAAGNSGSAGNPSGTWFTGQMMAGSSISGGGPGYLVRGSVYTRALIGGGSGTAYGVSPPYRFFLGDPSVNHIEPPQVGVGYGWGPSGFFINRVSGTQAQAEQLGGSGVVILTEYIGP